MAAASISILTATPASAAKVTAAMHLSPGHGPAGTALTATMQISGGGPSGQCAGGVVDFTFDSQPMGAAGVDQASCSASVAVQIPAGTPPGAHKVKGSLTGGIATASATATFTVDQKGPPQSSTSPNPTVPTIPNPTSTAGPTTTTKTTTARPTWLNTTTPTTPWTAPAFAPQPTDSASTPCDTSGDHAKDANSSFLLVEDYSAGQRIPRVGASGPIAQSTLVSQPLSSRLAVKSVGPPEMTPPQLGSMPYQSLEIIEPYDPAVSPKLQLAAAAGEPLGCVRVETAGSPGSGYGYLVYALKGALVVSSQELDPPTPTPAVTPTPSAKPGSKAPAAPAAPTTPAKPRFVRIVLGYSSISWEYQEAGTAQSPIHKGSGTIIAQPSAGAISYGNLVFAFGGLIAASVALMFAYHSRRRELLRRGRRRTASHA